MAKRNREQGTLNREGHVNMGFRDCTREEEIPLSFAGAIA